MRLVQAAVVALVGALALAGCTPAPVVTPTATPVPTFQCTPEAGGTASPCSQAQFDEMKRLDALYAEAEELNRRLRVEQDRLYRTGGADALTPELEAITAGTARTDALAFVQTLKALGSRLEVGDLKSVWVRRNPGLSKEGSEVSLLVCTDGREAVFRSPGRPDQTGAIIVEELYFLRVDAELKIWATEVVTERTECP